MNGLFRKTQTGLLPANQETEDWFRKVKSGNMVAGKFTKKQNSAFHAKMFALLSLGFENWEPAEVEVSIAGKPVVPEKNFDRFRKDLTILAGFYDVVVRLDGETRIEAKSLAFDRMTPDDRESIYSKFIDILLQNIYTGMDRAHVDKMVDQYLNFT